MKGVTIVVGLRTTAEIIRIVADRVKAAELADGRARILIRPRNVVIVEANGQALSQFLAIGQDQELAMGLMGIYA